MQARPPEILNNGGKLRWSAPHASWVNQPEEGAAVRGIDGENIWFVPVELATITQFVLSPALSKFVCICNRQPV